MKTSILLGAFCLVLSQLDFGEASPVGVVDDNNEKNGIENLVVSISVWYLSYVYILCINY